MSIDKIAREYESIFGQIHLADTVLQLAEQYRKEHNHNKHSPSSFMLMQAHYISKELKREIREYREIEKKQ